MILKIIGKIKIKIWCKIMTRLIVFVKGPKKSTVKIIITRGNLKMDFIWISLDYCQKHVPRISSVS